MLSASEEPRMQVTEMQRPHEGRGHGGTESSWHRSHPTWREKGIGVLNADGIASWQVVRRMMASSREPFMPPLERGPRWRLRKVGVVWRSIPPATLCLNYTMCSSKYPPPQAAGRYVMVGCFPLCIDGSVERGWCSRCRSGCGPSSMGKEEEEVNSPA